MPIDPRIALGVEPIKLESPISMMTNVMQLRNAQKQYQLQQQAEQKAQIEEGIKTISGYSNKADALTSLYEAFESDKIDKQHFDQMLGVLKKNPDWATAQQELLTPLLSAKDRIELQTQKQQQQQFKDIMGGGQQPTSAAVTPAPTNALAPVDQEQALFNKLNPSQQPVVQPAGTNALTTPDANTVNKQILALYALGTPQAVNTANFLKSQLEAQSKTYAPTEIEKLLALRKQYPVGTPERTALEDKIKLETTRAPAASTTVVMPPQELAEKKSWGEQLVKDYSESIKPAADQARKSLGTVDVLQNLLDKGLETGWGTDLEGQARSALARMGVEGAKDLAGDIQTFKAFVRQNVLNEQMKQKGVQTEGDAQRIEETFARLGNTTESNRFLLDVRRAQLNRDIAQQKFWNDWKAKRGTFDGAENAWLEGEGSKSLFDAPALKKYKATEKTTSTVRPTNVPSNWTLQVDNKGNKAWVSPDKKQHVEVK